MAARLVVDHHAAGVRFREAAVEQHDRAAALRKAADLASRSVGRGDDDAVDLFDLKSRIRAFSRSGSEFEPAIISE